MIVQKMNIHLFLLLDKNFSATVNKGFTFV